MAEIKEKIHDLLNSQQFAVLSTIVHDLPYPYCSIVGFVNSEDLKDIYFATDVNTSKFKNLTNNPCVSLLIDNRTNKNRDFEEAVALTVMGKTIVLNNEEKQIKTDFILSKLPELKEFLELPDCALIKIEIEKYIFVSKFQNVEEFIPEKLND